MAEKLGEKEFLELFYKVELSGNFTPIERETLEKYISGIEDKSKHLGTRPITSMKSCDFKAHSEEILSIYAAPLARDLIREHPEKFRAITYEQFLEVYDGITERSKEILICGASNILMEAEQVENANLN